MLKRFMKKKKKPAKKKTVKKKTTKKKKRKAPKKAFGGYKIIPDAALGKIIGNKAVTPSEMTKKIWQYIKRKKLSNR